MTLPGLHIRTSDYSTAIQVKEGQDEYTSKRRESNTGKRTRLLKRIPLNQLMDLKIDYAFKQLFGNEKNKEITVVFLNAILQKTGRDRIKDIAFSNAEINREYLDDKQSRLDLLVVTDADERINVEIQFTDQYDMVKRSIYYWSKLYARPFEKGMAYKELRPVIAINILNFDVFEQTERFHTSYYLYDDEDQAKLTNVMEFHFIEMGKLIKDWKADKLNPWNSILARWLLLLGMVDSRNDKVYDDIYQELEEIAMNDESLRETLKSWEELSMEQEQREAYEGRLKRILDEEAAKREAELNLQEAKQKAKQEGELEAKEAIARRLLSKGLNIDLVADATGLTQDKVVDIQHNMQE
ncbi:Rpn family recombination-promoting nuclease/putative transposase [Virgibacillus sp. 179-BFC.A HS]|uniref:Rpn family recombination-promoting nuclease/putative transposase n=1 Tax=Tigheibacillus jepli TaxID=3035914 RepID=A0ABU5CEV7_9BACI|nr:Rpn family recombination-promoting nuclease/putative transposase [Virgibacillus sp. 179-BFC.A HS]MDY0404867.1 Rpn family recombination-promoting nuclease/putative transposase [Virgibacillus sp. 179-BFC.A HS]